MTDKAGDMLWANPGATSNETVLLVTVKGPPVPWARARTGVGQDGRPTFHTAKPQKGYKRLVSDEARLALLTAKARGTSTGKPVAAGMPLIFDCRVFVPIPARWNKADNALARAGTIRPTSKPDLDNWLKLPMDALNGVAWTDDAQIVGFGGSGIWYSEAPRLEIHVYHAPPMSVVEAAARPREQGPPCPNCGVPVEVGQVVFPWEDAGEMHVDCAHPFAIPRLVNGLVDGPYEGCPPPVILIGSPMLQVSLDVIALTAMHGASGGLARVTYEDGSSAEWDKLMGKDKA